jgi:hypothetical protein
VKVLYDDDLASHIAPEPCVVVREDGVEASAGERAGWPSSRGAPGDRQEVEGESPSR